MKRNGFTLLELLIGISLISIVMIFLFRLLNDIQHEALSNTYIVANQTNRNEMINVLDTILYENGDVCNLYIGSSATNRLYKIGFCNNANNEISITISKRAVKIEYNSIKYNYEMRDSNGYYEIALPYTISSFNGKKYIRFNIVTHKKGLRETIIDDIEIMGTVQNLKVKKENVDEFAYTGDEQQFVVPKTGRYKIELWGASSAGIPDGCGWSGCGNGNVRISKGAYTSGTIQLTKDDILYVYVGAQGQSGKNINGNASYNGGGAVTDCYGDGNNFSGGGATDIRLVNGNWNNSESLASRIMVAAGGGGVVYDVGTEGHGGTIESNESSGPVSSTGLPATQTSGYQFGVGQSNTRSGGGGGYWGGQASNYAASGGSSYISGYPGCIAVTSITNLAPRNDSNDEECTAETALNDSVCSEHYSGKKFTSMLMKSGSDVMPTYDGEGTMTGNIGDGYAIISYIGS